MNIATEGIRHQTTCLGLLQQFLCLVGVATRGNAQYGVRQKLREAHLPVGPLNRSIAAQRHLIARGNALRDAAGGRSNACRHVRIIGWYQVGSSQIGT